ncbi:Membrane lipoprotein tmpc, partial [human gut metagenome]
YRLIATPCWNPQLNFWTAGIFIPPINPRLPSFNSTDVATPATNPACCSANKIETALSFNQGTWEGIEKAQKDFSLQDPKYLKPSGETKV